MVATSSLALVAFVLLRNNDRNTSEDIAERTDRLAAQQAELAGRLSQIAEADAASQKALSERLQNQEIAITKTLEERLADVTKVGDSLHATGTRSSETMTKLQEHLAVIDAAQKNITDLSAQVVQLQDVLTNRQARGAFGEIQLQDLVQAAALPPSTYEFQKTLGNNKRADCVLNLPNPRAPSPSMRVPAGAITHYGPRRTKLERRSTRAFAADVLKHVRNIAGYIHTGQNCGIRTDVSCRPEAVYAELYATTRTRSKNPTGRCGSFRRRP